MDVEFKVSFGKIARTLVYEDALGAFCFAFEVSPAEDQSQGEWNLYLGRQGLTLDGRKIAIQTETEQERVALAWKRAKQYASSQGYRVDVA